MPLHIVFTGGGTLGPVTPLLAVKSAIKASHPDARFSWIGTKDGPEGKFVAASGVEFHGVDAGKFRRYFSWKNFSDPFLVLKGYAESKRLLKKLAPDVVVSAGGFVAVPVTWAAGNLGIRVHIHQQDIRPGLANKLSLPKATSVSVAFEKSLADFAGKHPVWTGNPVRAELFTGSKEKARELFGLESGLPTVLVIGGGTGSTGLNSLVQGSLPALTEKVQLIHLTGAGKAAPVAGASFRYHQVEFLTDDMRHAYAAADMVVTRAGMGVLTELAALGLPAVIVPMPGSHQEENARFFESAGAAVTIDEAATISKMFAEKVLELLAHPERLETMRSAMRGLTKPDAAVAVAALISHS